MLPQVADLSEALRLLGEVALLRIVAMVLLAVGVLITVWFALARLVGEVSVRQAGTAHLLSTAVANTVPAGGAVTVAVNLRIYASFGRTAVPTTQGLLSAGLIDNGLKVALPLVAAGLTPLLPGELRVPPLVAWVAAVVAVGGVAVAAVLLRSEWVVHRAATWIQSALRRAHAPETRDSWARAAVGYQRQLRERLVDEGPVAGAALLASHLLQAAVLVLALRSVGVPADEVGVLTVVIAYALMRLITVVPITPGGLGIAELGLLGVIGLAAGSDTMPSVAAAVLLFRVLTYLLPVVLGPFAWLPWWIRQRSAR